MARWWLVALIILGAAPAAAGAWAAGGAPVLRAAGGAPVVIGAIYPTGGGQGIGGRDEFRGVSLAAEYVNMRGGLRGRRIEVWLERADSYDAAPDAVERLAAAGVTIVVGSHGSTISRPAAETASRLGVLFWETGAVGQFSMATAPGERVFRFAPTGASLGRAAVLFVQEQLVPRMKPGRAWRYAVAYVDDVYGRAVGQGAIAELRASGLPLVAALPYDLLRVNFDELAGRIKASRADVLVVASYLKDAVAMRESIVRLRVPLAVSIGTSSSYCMPDFGRLLGARAVGLFASDKPDGDIVRTDSLSPDAAHALRWARTEVRRRYGDAMSAPTLSGFAGGLALFRHVLPQARDLSATAVADTARRARAPLGSLPDGSGLAFAPQGHPDVGANLRAASVIWEWVRPGERAVVWPTAFATHPIVVR
jgi:branched-chain amino acid transport system substrate-binding protein